MILGGDPAQSLSLHPAFFLPVRNTLPLPQPALALSTWWTHSLPAGRARTAITWAEQLRSRENLYRVKWFTKQIQQPAVGMLTCWKAPLWSAFSSGKGERVRTLSKRKGKAWEHCYAKPLSIQPALCSQNKPSGMSPQVLLLSSPLRYPSKSLSWKSKSFDREQIKKSSQALFTSFKLSDWSHWTTGTENKSRKKIRERKVGRIRLWRREQEGNKAPKQRDRGELLK